MTKTAAKARRERKQIRAQVDQLLEGVELSSPFDIGVFCDAIARRRGRLISLIPTSLILGDLPAPFSGLWIAGPSADYVLYDDFTSPLHRENSILHEMGHLLFGHRSHGTLSDDQLALLQKLLPALSTERLREIAGGALGRAGYNGRQEREAELFAARVWELAGRALVTTSFRRDTDPEAQVLYRLADALGPADAGLQR